MRFSSCALDFELGETGATGVLSMGASFSLDGTGTMGGAEALEIYVRAHTQHGDGPTVLVVAGMCHELGVERGEEATPGMGGVVGLENVLTGVVQGAIAEEEAFAAQGEIGLVVALDGVCDPNHADLVVGATPAVAGHVAANFKGLVDLRVAEALMLAFVPAEAAEGANVGGELLLEVEPDAVLHGGARGVGGDHRHGG